MCYIDFSVSTTGVLTGAKVSVTTVSVSVGSEMTRYVTSGRDILTGAKVSVTTVSRTHDHTVSRV